MGPTQIKFSDMRNILTVVSSVRLYQLVVFPTDTEYERRTAALFCRLPHRAQTRYLRQIGKVGKKGIIIHH